MRVSCEVGFVLDEALGEEVVGTLQVEIRRVEGCGEK